MTTSTQKTCCICHKHYPNNQLHKGSILRESLVELIKQDYPDFDDKDYICTDDLNAYRTKYITQIIKGEKSELNKFDNDVLDNLKEQELFVKKLYRDYDAQITFWDRLADRIASFGGSWKFLGSFAGFILVWILVNVLLLVNNAYDPYPFILLNLILSCLASIQAPVIMMSQNRIETRDRMRAEDDFKINMKAEIEIKILHEKMDHLINNQWQKLLEIQQIQIELMEEMRQLKK